MKTKLFALIALGFASQASAALPPFFQSMREIRTVLNHQVLQEKFGSGRQIDGLYRNGQGYRVHSGKCSLQMNIVYLPREDGTVGPALFKVLPEKELECPED